MRAITTSQLKRKLFKCLILEKLNVLFDENLTNVIWFWGINVTLGERSQYFSNKNIEIHLSTG